MHLKQKLCIFLGILMMFILCGCSGQNNAPVPPAEPSASAAGASVSGHPIAKTAADVLSPYRVLLDKTSAEAPYSISHTIPQDMFSLLSRTAENMHVSPTGGRYAFTSVEESSHAYQATGMEVENKAAPTSDPSDETPMDATRMGDYSVQGGGAYKRTILFDVAEDLSQGRIEITNLLNGENTGHEVYTFVRRNDGFYFVDAAADLSVHLDTLASSGTYFVAIGRMTGEKVEVVEYHIASLAEMPQPESMDFDYLKNTVDKLSYLNCDKNKATFQ